MSDFMDNTVKTSGYCMIKGIRDDNYAKSIYSTLHQISYHATAAVVGS